MRKTKLARALRVRGGTISGLASELGHSRDAVRRIVAGLRRPSIVTALRLAAVLGCEVEELFAAEKTKRIRRR